MRQLVFFSREVFNIFNPCRILRTDFFLGKIVSSFFACSSFPLYFLENYFPLVAFDPPAVLFKQLTHMNIFHSFFFLCDIVKLRQGGRTVLLAWKVELQFRYDPLWLKQLHFFVVLTALRFATDISLLSLFFVFQVAGSESWLGLRQNCVRLSV